MELYEETPLANEEAMLEQEIEDDPESTYDDYESMSEEDKRL